MVFQKENFTLVLSYSLLNGLAEHKAFADYKETSVVYAIVFPNDSFYIGSTDNIKQRTKGHLYELISKTHHDKIQATFNKFHKFDVYVIENVTLLQEQYPYANFKCFHRENNYINKFMPSLNNGSIGFAISKPHIIILNNYQKKAQEFEKNGIGFGYSFKNGVIRYFKTTEKDGQTKIYYNLSKSELKFAENKISRFYPNDIFR